MNAKVLKWDDFRIVLAVGNANSLSGAANLTGLSHATIFRRLSDIESRLGEKLFWRHREGYLPTGIGEEVLYTAAQIEDEINNCQRKITGQDMNLEGTIRVTTTDTLLYGLVGPCLKRFMESQPKIKIELITTNRLMDLTRRDADVAIRPVDYPDTTIVGRRIARISQAIFTHLDNPAPISLEENNYSLIEPDSEMRYSRLEKWFASNKTNNSCFVKTNSILSDFNLLRSGYGYAVLPCYLGDPASDIKRASGLIPELCSELWILTHPDFRNTLRIRKFMEHMHHELTNRLKELNMEDQNH